LSQSRIAVVTTALDDLRRHVRVATGSNETNLPAEADTQYDITLTNANFFLL